MSGGSDIQLGMFFLTITYLNSYNFGHHLATFGLLRLSYGITRKFYRLKPGITLESQHLSGQNALRN